MFVVYLKVEFCNKGKLQSLKTQYNTLIYLKLKVWKNVYL